MLLPLWLPSKQTSRSSKTRRSAEFQKMEMSFTLSKKQSRWLAQAPRSAFSTFKIIVWSCLHYVQTDKAMNIWTLTAAPYMQFSALHAHLKLQSLPKVNRMTIGLLEEFLVKTDMGWFLTTDRPQISIHKYYREANWGWPSHKHSTNLFLLSRTESIMCHRQRPTPPSPHHFSICALC